MWEMIKRLFARKKTRAVLAGLAVIGARKAGLDLSIEEAGLAIGLLSSYMLGQGFADWGKEAKAAVGGAVEDARTAVELDAIRTLAGTKRRK